MTKDTICPYHRYIGYRRDCADCVHKQPTTQAPTDELDQILYGQGRKWTVLFEGSDNEELEARLLAWRQSGIDEARMDELTNLLDGEVEAPAIGWEFMIDSQTVRDRLATLKKEKS